MEEEVVSPVVEPKKNFIEGIKANYAAHKKVYAILGLLGTFFLLFAFILLSYTANSQNNAKNAQKTTPKNSSTAEDGQPLNPLVPNKEIDRVHEAEAAKYKKAGKVMPTAPKYKFNYQLAPSLSEKKGSFLQIASALAIGGCNLTSAPTEVKGYLLKAHYPVAESNDIAKTFKMDTAAASSVPGEDGVSFQYYYSEPKTSAYFKLSEPSGTYTYHSAVLDKKAAEINQDKAKAVALKALTDHKLGDNLILTGSSADSVDPTYDAFTFSFLKKFDLKVADNQSVAELPDKTTVCGVGAAKTMNYIQVLVGKHGELGKLINQTRLITSEITLPRESIDDAMAEYKDHLPIPPIVAGTGVADPTSTVTIDEAVLSYFDYGDFYGQYAYTPVYITSGRTSKGVRIFTIFPAVSGKELDKTPLAPKEHQGLNLQLDTFNPAPPKPEGKLCFGNLVDYTLNCSANAQQVCGGFVSLPSDKNDPFGVCAKGCITKTEVFNVSAGKDPCAEFMKKKGLPENYGGGGGGIAPGGGAIPPASFPGGDVSCTLGGCPC